MGFLDKCVPAFVIMIVVYTYYAYVFELCFLKITNLLKKILYLVGYHLCLLPVIIYYFTTMFIRSAPVPSNYRFSAVEVETLSRPNQQESVINRTLERFCYFRGIQTYTRKNNRIRYCLKCMHIKPDRTHHCSSCRICVLKMDHHCPWIDNCIHFDNYKLFFLLLLHTTIYCIYYVGTSAEYVYGFFIDEIVMRELTYVVGVALAVLSGTAVAALLGFHIALMLRNQTTLEALTEPVFVDNCTFDLGAKENFYEVFGYNCCLWWLPCSSSLGNGVHFPVRYY